MGPELLLGATLLSGAATGYSAIASSQAANAQAEADTQRAAIESQWADRRAKEERAAAQRVAIGEARKADLAQSRLTAAAGASGSGASDPTVMDLWSDIEREGQVNSGNATAAGEQAASGINYQADLGRWTADANARIKRSSANATLIGGLLNAGSTIGTGYGNYKNATTSRSGTYFSPMASRYTSLGGSSGTYYNDYGSMY